MKLVQQNMANKAQRARQVSRPVHRLTSRLSPPMDEIVSKIYTKGLETISHPLFLYIDNLAVIYQTNKFIEVTSPRKVHYYILCDPS